MFKFVLWIRRWFSIHYIPSPRRFLKSLEREGFVTVSKGRVTLTPAGIEMAEKLKEQEQMNKREDICTWIEEHAREYAEKAAPAYKGLEWKWTGIDRIPDAEDIHHTILEMLELFRKRDYGGVNAGGVRININEPFIRFDKKIEAFYATQTG